MLYTAQLVVIVVHVLIEQPMRYREALPLKKTSLHSVIDFPTNKNAVKFVNTILCVTVHNTARAEKYMERLYYVRFLREMCIFVKSLNEKCNLD